VILDALMIAFRTVSDWALTMLPTEEPPEWLATVVTFVNGLLVSAAGLGAWVPWDFLIIVALFVFNLWLGIALVKAVRWVLNWIPTWGGS